MKWGAILHRKWEKGEAPNHIIHYWAEDNSVDQMIVPSQIRDQIVEMQNWLAGKYQKTEQLKHRLSKAMEFFEED